jgi:hypothetical protein
VAGVGVAVAARGGPADDGEAVVVEGARARMDVGSEAPPPETFEVDEAAPVPRTTINEEPVGPADEYVAGKVKVDEMGGLIVSGADGETSLRLTAEQVRTARYIPADPFAPGGSSACLDLGDGRRIPVPADVSPSLPTAVTYGRADQVKGTPQ